MTASRERIQSAGVLTTVILALVLLSLPLSAQSNQQDKVRNLYRQGVQQLEEDKVDEAYNSFQKSIEAANDLSPEVRGELLRWLWEKTSTKLFNRMLENPELRPAAERILELSKGAYWSWKMDDSRINKLVDNLTSDEYKVRLESKSKLIAAGQYAAPRLIEELNSDNSELRSMAVMTLSEMGEKVVLPVIEALESQDELTRRNAALVLGNLEDPRALPALKHTYMNDEKNLVKREAREAMLSILDGRLPERVKDELNRSERRLLGNILRARIDEQLLRLARRKQNHTHDWSEIKENYVKVEDNDSKPNQTSGSSDHILWEAAGEIGLRNIYVDDAGLKYIEHAHDVNIGGRVRENYTHRHYLSHLRGLPSQLKQYVFRKRAERAGQIVNKELDQILAKSPRETQRHQHPWEEVKGDLLRRDNEEEKQGSTIANRVDDQIWPGAKPLGLKNIFVDERGMKYIIHTHDRAQEKGANALGQHRHYLRNIVGLPSRLKRYVDYWRALEIRLYKSQTLHALASPEKLYHRLAESYYNSEPVVMRSLYGDALVWSWNDERQRVESRKVPEYAFNLELAVQASLDGLEANPRYRPNWPLLVSSYFAMYDQSETILLNADEYTRMEIMEEKSIERLQKDLENRDLMLLPGQIMNAETLYAVLNRAIMDQKPAVAAQSLEYLSGFVETDHLPGADEPAWEQRAAKAYPVISALSTGTKMMKFTAAALLANMKPLKKFHEWTQVVPSLAEAVSMTGVRKVVVSTGDQEQINRLRRVLRDPNLQSEMQIAQDTNELLTRAKTSPLADMILVSGDMLGKILYSFSVPGREQDHQQRVIDALKNDIRTRNVPLIAIADSNSQGREIKEIYQDRVDYVIEAPVTVKKLLDVLSEDGEGLARKSAGLKFKRNTSKLSLQAARALGSIRTNDTVFDNYRGAVVALTETLKGRPDELRKAACEALGWIGDKRAIPPLLKTLDRGDDPVDVRAAAGYALAQVFRRLEFKPSDIVLNRLLKNAKKGEKKVQRAASRAFGAADVKPERRYELLKQIKDQIEKEGTASAEK